MPPGEPDVHGASQDAQTWDSTYSSGAMERLRAEAPRYRAVGRFVEAGYPEAATRDVLDAGCGAGLLLDFLPPFRTYTGFDISAVALAEAPPAPRGVTFQVGTIESFEPFEPCSVLIFNEVLYYTDFTAVLRRYRSLLRPGGIVVTSLYVGPGADQTTLRSIAGALDQCFSREHREFVEMIPGAGWVVTLHRLAPAPDGTDTVGV